MTFRLWLARKMAPTGYVVVPQEPTRAMLKAACASMSPGKRPTPDWVSVMKKHQIRYQAMIVAAAPDDALPLRLAKAAIRRQAQSKPDIEKLAGDLVAAGESEYDTPTAGQ